MRPQQLASKKRHVDQRGGGVRKVDTLEELASMIEVPAKPLTDTVKKWNDFITSGEKVEPLTNHVDFTTHTITDSPFFTAPLVPGVSLTCRGFRTTTSL